MSSRPPPKQQSIASLLWEILRLGARAIWGSPVNPVRPILERQQALAVLGLPANATRQQIKAILRHSDCRSAYRDEPALRIDRRTMFLYFAYGVGCKWIEQEIQKKV